MDIADLQAHLSLVNYRKTILNAVEQVDTALAAYSAQQDRMENLGDAMLAAQRAVDLATERYNRGLTDYLNVVDAERQFYDLQEQYAMAQVTQAEQFVPALQESRRRLAELPVRSRHPAAAAGHRCRVSTRTEQFGAVMICGEPATTRRPRLHPPIMQRKQRTRHESILMMF